MTDEPNLLTILGPTASGKTKIAACVADKINGEIISADSRQVYRRMDIGTGKDYRDYMVGDKTIPFHLIDIREPGQKYNVFEYQQDFFKIYHDVHRRDKFPILCGGSGLYIEAVLDAYKMLKVPEDRLLRRHLESKSLKELSSILAQYKFLHNTTDIDTKKRAIRAIEIAKFQKENMPELTDFPHINSLNIGIASERKLQKKQITDRLTIRLNNGMLEEVRSLLDEGLTGDDLIYYGLEYKYVIKYITGELTYDEMFEKLNIAIHQFSKRQMTWFRRMERKGTTIHWIDGESSQEEKVDKILLLFNRTGSKDRQ